MRILSFELISYILLNSSTSFGSFSHFCFLLEYLFCYSDSKLSLVFFHTFFFLFSYHMNVLQSWPSWEVHCSPTRPQSQGKKESEVPELWESELLRKQAEVIQIQGGVPSGFYRSIHVNKQDFLEIGALWYHVSYFVLPNLNFWLPRHEMKGSCCVKPLTS